MRRRKKNPGIGTLLLIGTVTAVAIGGAGYAIMQARKPKAKPKKKLQCDVDYEVRMVDGIEVCLPIGQPKPATPKKPSEPALEAETISMPTPKNTLAGGACPGIAHDIVFDYMLGNGTAQGAVSEILSSCGVISLGQKRQAVLEFIVDIAAANANLSGAQQLRDAALAVM